MLGISFSLYTETLVCRFVVHLKYQEIFNQQHIAKDLNLQQPHILQISCSHHCVLHSMKRVPKNVAFLKSIVMRHLRALG
jgi:hypothetical protein